MTLASLKEDLDFYRAYCLVIDRDLDLSLKSTTLNKFVKSLCKVDAICRKIDSIYIKNLPYDLEKLSQSPNLLMLFLTIYPRKYHKIAKTYVERK